MRDEFGRKSKRLPDVRLSVTGDSNVGKSAITVRFLTRRFIGEYQKNVEQTYRGIIHFGADAIKYDLKDSSRWHDKISLLNWSTCIAVIYSITDKESYATASSILDDIYSTLNQTAQFKKRVPCIALIGNKKDLEHLREVKEEDAKNLAKSYGVGFWEVSASDDYHSTYTPLNSLIIESFLSANGNHLKFAASSSCIEKIPKGDIITDDLRRKSESTHLRERMDIDIGGTIGNGSASPFNSIKRMKKPHKQDQTKKNDIHPPESPSESDNVSNITIEVTTPSDEVIPIRKSRRSGSWTKVDKRRVVRRKTTEQKAAMTIAPMPKSRSYTDLKSLEKERGDQEEGRIVQSVSAIMLNTKELNDDEKSEKMTGEEDETFDDVFFNKIKKTASSTSLSKLASFEVGKNYWIKVKKDRRKALNLSLENMYEKSISKINDSEQNCNKLSVRRKISQMFRPRSLVEST